MNTKPIEITLAEWREIIEVPAVRDAWGLTDHTPEEVASFIYGVKFSFTSGSPGYCGDLYLLFGDGMSENPVILIRDKGKLVAER